MKFAIYLDELDIDPEKACVMAHDLGLAHICLRRLWATNICSANDHACQYALEAIKRYHLEVVAVCSDIGRVPAHELSLGGELGRALLITNYFGARHLRLFAGQRTTISIEDDAIQNWMIEVAKKCAGAAVLPLLEIDADAHVFEHEGVYQLLATTGWSLLYDPVNLVLRRNQNPFARYWTRLKQFVIAFDAHDYKISNGYRPIGAGDCRWKDTLADMALTKFSGWCFVEPGQYRQNGVPVGRREAAQTALNTIKAMLATTTLTIPVLK